jgi:hypothetical protein
LSSGGFLFQIDFSTGPSVAETTTLIPFSASFQEAIAAISCQSEGNHEFGLLEAIYKDAQTQSVVSGSATLGDCQTVAINVPPQADPGYIYFQNGADTWHTRYHRLPSAAPVAAGTPNFAIHVVNAQGNPVSGVLVQAYDQNQKLLAQYLTGPLGNVATTLPQGRALINLSRTGYLSNEATAAMIVSGTENKFTVGISDYLNGSSWSGSPDSGGDSATTLTFNNGRFTFSYLYNDYPAQEYRNLYRR